MTIVLVLFLIALAGTVGGLALGMNTKAREDAHNRAFEEKFGRTVE